MAKNDTTNKNVSNSYTHPKTGKFVKGNPGGGRPKGSGISITTEIKKKLSEVPEGQKATYLELLIQRIMKQAIQDGDAQMIKQLWAYIDGMPKQSIEHSGNIGGQETLSDEEYEKQCKERGIDPKTGRKIGVTPTKKKN